MVNGFTPWDEDFGKRLTEELELVPSVLITAVLVVIADYLVVMIIMAPFHYFAH